MPDYATAWREPSSRLAPPGHAYRRDAIAPATAEAVAAEVRHVRIEAQARYSEVDLLVATLRDHIRDLRLERDALRAQLARSHEAAHLATSTWLPRGMKPPR